MLDTLNRYLRVFLGQISMLLVATLTLVVVAGVAFRKLGASLVWYDEVASILLVWLTYYGSCLVALDRAHIGFPNLVRSLNPPLARLVGFVRETVVVGFFLALAWAGWRVLLVLEGNYLVSLPWIPTQLTQSVIPIGSILFVIAELASLGRRNTERSP